MTGSEWAAVITAMTGLVVAVGGLYIQIEKLRRMVDGRLTQLLEVTATSSHAAGVLQEQQSPASRPSNVP